MSEAMIMFAIDLRYYVRRWLIRAAIGIVGIAALVGAIALML